MSVRQRSTNETATTVANMKNEHGITLMVNSTRYRSLPGRSA